MADKRVKKKLNKLFEKYRNERIEVFKDFTKEKGLYLEIRGPYFYPWENAIGKIYKIIRGGAGPLDAIRTFGYVKKVNPELSNWDFPITVLKQHQNKEGNLVLKCKISFKENNPTGLPGDIKPEYEKIEIELFEKSAKRIIIKS